MYWVSYCVTCEYIQLHRSAWDVITHYPRRVTIGCRVTQKRLTPRKVTCCVNREYKYGGIRLIYSQFNLKLDINNFKYVANYFRSHIAQCDSRHRHQCRIIRRQVRRHWPRWNSHERSSTWTILQMFHWQRTLHYRRFQILQKYIPLFFVYLIMLSSCEE